MAKAVAEGAGVVLLDDVPGYLVYVLADHAGLHRVYNGHLGLQHRLIDLSLLVADLAESHRAGHVGVVAVQKRAGVHGYEVALLHSVLAWHRVALGAAFARRHN